MFFTTGLSALFFLAAASAQTVVTVGFTASDPGGIFQFRPNNFNAANGTTVTFQFTGAPGNHSVTQSVFYDPCHPVPGGFDSGWLIIPSAPSPVPKFNITITDDTQPIFFFCKQNLPTPHCGSDMVGVINAPNTKIFNEFLDMAASFGPQGSGQNQGGLVGIGAFASAGIGPIPNGATAYTGPIIDIASPTGSGSGLGSASAIDGGGPPPLPTINSASSSSISMATQTPSDTASVPIHKVKTVLITGAVIGVAVLVGVVFAAFLLLNRRSPRRHEETEPTPFSDFQDRNAKITATYYAIVPSDLKGMASEQQQQRIVSPARRTQSLAGTGMGIGIGYSVNGRQSPGRAAAGRLPISGSAPDMEMGGNGNGSPSGSPGRTGAGGGRVGQEGRTRLERMRLNLDDPSSLLAGYSASPPPASHFYSNSMSNANSNWNGRPNDTPVPLSTPTHSHIPSLPQNSNASNPTRPRPTHTPSSSSLSGGGEKRPQTFAEMGIYGVKAEEKGCAIM